MYRPIDEELEFEIDQLEFQDFELNGQCENCDHYDEIDSNGDHWTILDYKTHLCHCCFQEEKEFMKQQKCNCVNGCNRCLMTNY